MDKRSMLSQLKWLVKLANLHGETVFRLRAYEKAIRSLRRLPDAYFERTVLEWPAVEGLGDSLRQAISVAQTSGKLPQLAVWEEKTPAGIQDLLHLRGFTPAKLGALWRELGVASASQLEQACLAGKVAQIKGFGAQTEARLLALLRFYAAQKGKLRWDEALYWAKYVENDLQHTITNLKIRRTGLLCRASERLDGLEWIVEGVSVHSFEKALLSLAPDWVCDPICSSPYTIAARLMPINDTKLVFYICATPHIAARRHFLSSADATHLSFSGEMDKTFYGEAYQEDMFEEKALYANFNLPIVPYSMREAGWTQENITQKSIDGLVQAADLRGVLHCHSHYSDGQDSLADMARHAQHLGYEYLGISDHSQSAFYADGLHFEDIQRQHKEIDALNAQMAPFFIFKGIECDILPDGSLDYPDEVLGCFDFVIISVHSHLQMSKEQATERLLRAISHPCAHILGHLSGRLLLERSAYELDYEAVLTACAQYGVAAEFNANARRLDISWRWIAVAQAKGVRLALNADAHEKGAISDMRTSLPVAQKGGLQRENTINTYNCAQLAEHFSSKKRSPLI